MSQQDLINEMITWTKNNGLGPLNNPCITLENIIELDGKRLRAMSFDEIEDILLKLSSYNLYLRNLKATISAQITKLETSLNRKLHKESKLLMGKYMSRDERETTVLEMYPRLKEDEQQLVLLKMKYSKLKEIPYNIDGYIDIIKIIYRRKLDVKKGFA